MNRYKYIGKDTQSIKHGDVFYGSYIINTGGGNNPRFEGVLVYQPRDGWPGIINLDNVVEVTVLN